MGQAISYAFTSHLRRARETLQIVLRDHPLTPVFIDDRLTERRYGLFQGKNKAKMKHEILICTLRFIGVMTFSPKERG
jgi:bisphosphoglycerate-dependent phosphoglycerate mutase